MDLLLFLLGILLIIGSLVYLVISLIKKSFAKKKILTIFGSGFILIIVGLFMPVSTTETAVEPQEEVEDVKKNEESYTKVQQKQEKEPESTEVKKVATKAEEQVKKETEESEKEVKDITESDAQLKDENTEIGKSTIAALESNDFYAFVEEYKMLGTNKTLVWDNHLYGKKVTWTGTVVRAGTSQLFVYGGQDYNNESWAELGEEDKLFYTFVAKYSEGTADEFKKLQTGDKVTVVGDLESRGDFDLNFNWKIYNSYIK